ncbi:MAG: alpha/beta hydrolase [Candidatus Dojkabacteria bacterium]|nr:MAG: alpha/beta hydrolase [Candidatus Dojkabacteria bacterium]
MELRMQQKKKSADRRKLLFFGVIAIFAIVTAGIFITSQKNSNTGTSEPTPTTLPTPTPTEDPYITLNETPQTEGGHFFEKTPVIGGQQAYVAYPMRVNKYSPPQIIIYSHGSNTTVTTDFDDEFMQNMRGYGDFFTKEGYVFAASAMHGANWGNQASVDDMKKLADWISEQYSTQDKINLLAHSMGGLSTLKFGFQHSSIVNKIALLAPTSYANTYKQADFDKLTTIDVIIWHGDKDVNVPWSMSNQLVNRAKSLGKTITFHTLSGKGHWDVDTELKQEILDFYSGVGDSIESAE